MRNLPDLLTAIETDTVNPYTDASMTRLDVELKVRTVIALEKIADAQDVTCRIYEGSVKAFAEALK